MKPKLKDIEHHYARCRMLLKRREREAGLEPNPSKGLANDYFLPCFDGDPLAEEFRQLSKAWKAAKWGDGADEDPLDPPQRNRTQKREDDQDEQ